MRGEIGLCRRIARDAGAAQVHQHRAADVRAHGAEPRVRPHEHEARPEAAAAHAVIAGAVGAAGHHRVARHARVGDGIDELCRILGDAVALGFRADHEAGDVLQEQDRHVALVAQLDEMRALQRRIREQHAVVGDDADRKAVDMGEAANERGAIERLEFVELAAVDEARDDLALVERLLQIGADDAGNFRRIEQAAARTGRMSP